MIVLLIFAFLFLTSSLHAGYWSIHCINYSCEASQGALKIFWTPRNLQNMYIGELTGVEGVPVKMSDFQAIEQKLEQTIEKSSTKQKASKAGAGIQSPEGKLEAESGGGQENIFTKRKSISQSLSRGEQISVDYTLAFVRFLGDEFFPEPTVQKYFGAMELILKKYYEGQLEPLIEAFILWRNAGRLQEVPVSSVISDENRYIQLAKYLGAAYYPSLKEPDRYKAGASYVAAAIIYQDVGREKTAEIQKYVQGLLTLMQPGITALKLYEKGLKDLAFAKWLADYKYKEKFSHLSLEERYIAAISAVEKFRAQELHIGFLIPPQDWTEFENAIRKKDPSVKIVTVPSKFNFVLIIAIVASSFLSLTVFYVLYRKKKFKSTLSHSESH